ncbi:hypothetical protein NC661_06545 [Aquibacillus koreensis]|uniref:Uncharacterized protein n=1 Tax=Aquibacillus koreensis TaxID=279446 RepID=A0A9X4AJ26_9BACI|nr:hypothetical protein [Aquibacillus koreensis]MCT2535690.1 hypothetical protein [Aquibacillus koreensis]MDC3420025.1 hypothetical protein [Aquibacillus koreensis]
MPHITTFIYSEETKNTPNNKLNVINPLNVFRPAFVPGMFSFSVTFGVIGIDVTEKGHTVRIKFSSSDKRDEPIIDTEDLSLENIPSETATLPPNLRGIMGSLDFRNVVMRAEGEYFTEIFVDGDKLGEYPIYVLAGDQG